MFGRLVYALMVLSFLPLGQAQVRQYYLAAEEQIWDFAPSGQNLVHCYPEPEPCPLPEPWANSHRFPMIRFIQYTDATFTARVPQPEWLGILGPILRAEVGDELRVRLCNRAGRSACTRMVCATPKSTRGRIIPGSTRVRGPE